MMRFTHEGRTVRDTPSLLVTGFNFPEGPAFDRAGNLDIAHCNGSRVDIPESQGRQIDHVPVPGASVTNVAFGGPDRRTLVITDVATASLCMTRVEIPGLRLFDGT